MSIFIGENIKRLRQQKNITQEKLAEYLSISAPAVSKWERGETLPDIGMIIPIASYFQVSTDELLGYDEAAIKIALQNQLDEYHELYRVGKLDESSAVISELRKSYPNDFLIAQTYMYHFIGGRADNSQAVLLKHADEFMPICQRILSECTIDTIRLEAAAILAKIYKAQGEYEKAISCFDNFPNWHAAKDQMLEQLHAKDTEEFRYWVNCNLFELMSFAFNKASKSIWYKNDSVEARIVATHQIIEVLENYIAVSGYELAYHFMAEVCHEGGKVLYQEKEYEKAIEFYASYLSCKRKVVAFFSSGRPIIGAPDKVKDSLALRYGDNAIDSILKWMESNPFFEELRKHENFCKKVLGGN